MDKNNGAIYDARKLGKPKMIILGVQHMFAMFGASVLVPFIFAYGRLGNTFVPLHYKV